MIKKYQDEYFTSINEMVEESWKNEVKMDSELQSFIYNFLVRYYLVNKNLSYVDYSSKVDAFLLASFKNDQNNSIEWFNCNINSLSEENQIKAKLYLEYLEYNHNKVLNYMNDNDIYLDLIASKKHNSGRLLIDNLNEIAKKTNSSIFLWTDETCNYKYYEKLNYELLEEYVVVLYDKKLKTFIYKNKK